MRTKPKGAKSGLFDKFEQMSLEQDSSTQQGAREAKERRRVQEEQEKIRQREINREIPRSPEETGESRDVGEPSIVRYICRCRL